MTAVARKATSRKTATRPRQKRLKPEERRAQLTQATLGCLARYGAQGAGLRQVCRDLEIAPSLVNYLFGGWNELLLSAYRLLAQRSLEEYEQIGRSDRGGAERLRRLIERNVSSEWLSDEVVGAYIALWDLSRTVPELKSEFTRFHRARRRIVAKILADLAGAPRVGREIDLKAAGLVVFLDGFWLELGLNPGNIPLERAVEMCWVWITNNFPQGVGARRRR
jgi:TetR/AcrR family transcriptional repressor of bet genes